MTDGRLALVLAFGLAAACLAAVSMPLPAQAGCRATLQMDGGRWCLPEEEATALLCDLLARAEEVYDGKFQLSEVAELAGRWPSAELRLPASRIIAGPGLGGPQPVSRILVVFQAQRPRFIFWGNPDWNLAQVLSAPQLGEAPLASLRELARSGAPAAE